MNGKLIQKQDDIIYLYGKQSLPSFGKNASVISEILLPLNPKLRLLGKPLH